MALKGPRAALKRAQGLALKGDQGGALKRAQGLALKGPRGALKRAQGGPLKGPRGNEALAIASA